MDEPLEQIYRRYYRELYRFLVVRCPNADMVDDIIQNTFLEALKSMESFSGRSSVKTWLFAIAKHQLYRHLRKQKSHADLEQVPEAALAQRTEMADRMVAQHILDWMDRLDPPFKDIMKLRLVDGLSFKEIGMRVNRTETYCRVNFFRMKEKLRKEHADENM